MRSRDFKILEKTVRYSHQLAGLGASHVWTAPTGFQRGVPSTCLHSQTQNLRACAKARFWAIAHQARPSLGQGCCLCGRAVSLE
eukprot:699270-Amphidinium_carterae.1